MAAYYSGPRVRLPSNRSLQLTDSTPTSSPLSPSPPLLTSPPAALSNSLAPILIFPAPSSEPASPHPSTSRSRTQSALAHGPLRLRHARVDSNASSASLVVCSSVTDLSSPLSANSPRLARSPLQSASDWDDLGAVSGPSTGTASSPLTRERIVRLGSARMIPSSWRSISGSGGSAETPSVEMWEWTSNESELDAGRGLWGEAQGDGGTNYEDALSQFHFPTLEESRFACPVERAPGHAFMMGVASLEERALVSVQEPTHPALGQRVISLPFRFLLETFLGITPATFMLLERGSHHPDSIAETGLFGAATGALPAEEEDGLETIERNEEMEHRVSLHGALVARSVRRGFDTLVHFAPTSMDAGVPLSLPLIPLKVSVRLVASIPQIIWTSIPPMPKWRSLKYHVVSNVMSRAGHLATFRAAVPEFQESRLLAPILSLAVSHAQVGDRFSRAQMMHNSPPSHQPRHFPISHHTDSMLPSFSQQQQPQQSQHHAITPSQTDLATGMFDEGQQQPQVRKRGGRGPGKKDVDRPSISVRWEEGDLTERLIQALERPDRQWHAVIAQVGPEHTRVVIGVPKRDLQREIARHLFANDPRYDLEDKRTIEPLAVSVKNKLFKIVNLYQDCERELSEWQGMFNDEREIAASNDPNVAAAWGRVKEKLPQFFRVRDLIKRTQTTGVATNSIPSSGQTSPTRATAQNPQVRGSTQAPQVPTPQTPRHPASGSLGESSTSATRPTMQNSGHPVATLGLNLSGQHSPATRTFVQQQPQQQQHGGNMPFAYGMPQTPHIQQQLQQQQQQAQQAQQQQQQQQFQQQSQAQAQHHQTHTHQRIHSQSQSHQAPHVLSMQHQQRQYAAPGNAGPTSASAPSPSFPTSQNILTRSPALPPPPAPIAGSSSQRPQSAHRAVSVSRTTGGPSRASPVGRHSSSPSPSPPSPPLSVTKVMTFLDGYESRKRKREEDLFALKRMRYEDRDKERAEREKQRQHEREMMRLRIELARTERHEQNVEGENELDHLAPG